MPFEDGIDPRTRMTVGAVPEEEIISSFAETKAVQLVADIDPETASTFKDVALDGVKQENPFTYNLKVAKDLIDIFSTSAKIGNLQSRELILRAQHLHSGNHDELAEADKIADEIATMESKLHPDINKMWTAENATKLMSTTFGQLYHRAKNLGPQAAKAYLKSSPATAILPLGNLVAPILTELSYSAKMGIGEIAKSFGDLPIDNDIKQEVATQVGSVTGSIDTLSQAFDLVMGGEGAAAKTVFKKVLGFATAQGVEGGTEVVQNIGNNFAITLALNKQAERDGKPQIQYTFEDLTKDSWENFYGGAVAGATVAGAGYAGGKAIQHSAKSIDLVRADLKKQKEERIAKIVKEEEEQVKQEVLAASTHDIETVPRLPAEIDEIVGVDGVTAAPDITEQVIDDAIAADDVNASADSLIAAAEDSSGVLTAEINSDLKTILPDHGQNELVMSLLSARAEALGKSVEKYIGDLGLEVRESNDTPVGTKERPKETTRASIEFVNDSQTIIRAFDTANVTSMVHELGHLFRRDLGTDDTKVLADWAGVTEDGVWTRAAEEKVAKAFEQYVMEGKAPSVQLESTFAKLSKWMLNIYKELKKSVVGPPINNDIRAVFDRMLTDDKQARTDIAKNNFEARVLEQNDNPDLRPVAKPVGIRSEVAKILTKLKDLEVDTDAYIAERNNLKVALSRKQKRVRTAKTHAALGRKIKSKLRSHQPKGRSGKQMSKMDYATQVTITELHEALRVVGTRKGALDFLAKHEKKNGGMATSALEAIKVNMATAMADRSEENNAVLAGIYNSISDIIATGMTKSALFQVQVKANKIALNNIKSIIGDRSLSEVRQLMRLGEKGDAAYRAHRKSQRRWGKWIEWVRTNSIGKDFLFGWGGMLNIVSNMDPRDMGESQLYKELSFFKERQQQETDVREQSTAMANAYDAAYGITGKTEAIKSFKRNSQRNKDSNPIIDIGTKLKISKAQLRLLWLYFNTSNEAEMQQLYASGYDENVRQIVEKRMQKEDRQFATALYKYWNSDDTFNPINDVYKRMAGVDLGRQKKYVPRRVKMLDKPEEGQRVPTQFEHDKFSRRTPDSSSSLKKRTSPEESVISLPGDFELFDRYVEEMAHFKAFSEKVRLVRSVVENSVFADAVGYMYSSKMLKSMKTKLSNIAADGPVMSSRYAILDNIRTAYVTSTLGLSLGVMAKQGISIANYWQHMPLSGYWAMFRNPAQYLRDVKVLAGSDFLKNRQFERDMKEYTADNAYKKFVLNPTAKNLMTMNVRFGDKAAIAIGGALYYRHLLDNGWSEESALVEVAEKSDRTQQSGHEEELSNFQSGGSMSKFSSTYSTGPVQAMRQELEAIRLMAKGDSKLFAKGVKTLLIYHFIVPSMYSLASSVITSEEGEWLDEDWLAELMWNAGLGPLGASYSFGRDVSNALRKAFGLKKYQDSSIFTSTLNDITKAATKVVQGDIEDVDFQEWAALIEGISIAFNRPLPIKRVAKAGENALNEDYWRMAFGLTPDE